MSSSRPRALIRRLSSSFSANFLATAVSEFVEKGYLTEALNNFVALLGWAPSDGVELKSLQEIAADFRINEVSSSNSVFEYDKLNWMNGQYIKKMDIKELTAMAKPFLSKYDLTELTEEQLEKVITATREPITILSDLTNDVAYFFGKDIEFEEGVKEANIDTEQGQAILKEFASRIDSLAFDDEEKLHEQMAEFRNFFKEQGIKPKVTMWTIRAALTGRTHGADMGVVLEVLGKDKVQYRIEKAIV